jgi:hypothetical protein
MAGPGGIHGEPHARDLRWDGRAVRVTTHRRVPAERRCLAICLAGVVIGGLVLAACSTASRPCRRPALPGLRRQELRTCPQPHRSSWCW